MRWTNAVGMDGVHSGKSFTYHSACEWAGGKAAVASSGEKPQIRISSPERFRGEPNLWTPEDLLISAVETCLLLTFVALAEKRDLGIEAYYSEAVGLLQWVEGKYRFAHIVVKPTIIITDLDDSDDVLRTVDDAQASCLIANSIHAEVVVEPEVTTRDAA